MPLTAKQQRFVEEYRANPNATEAYLRAGYKAKNRNVAGVEAHKLLRKPKIAEAVATAREEAATRLKLSRDETLREYAKLGFSNMLDYVTPQADGSAVVDLSRITRDQAAAISEVTVDAYTERNGDDLVPVKKIKFKLADKKGALDSICKVMGWAPDRHEHTGKDGGPIEFADLTDDAVESRASDLLRKAGAFGALGRAEPAGSA